jgi:exodeoxyribonuclease VII small subunit
MSDDRQQQLPENVAMAKKKTNKGVAKTSVGEEIGFADAIAELETILGRIEGEEIDIDELASELKRATALLETCRARVRKAEAEVTQVVKGLEVEPEPPSE